MAADGADLRIRWLVIGMHAGWTAVRRRIAAVAAGIRAHRVAVALLVAAVVALAVTVGLSAGGSKRRPADSPGGDPVPPGAAQTAQDLVSGDGRRVRAALTPVLGAQVRDPHAIAPAGSALKLDSGSWSRAGRYASATGLLTSPGRADRRVVVGFVGAENRWQVTVMEQW
jgi:hypothetical protein